MLATHGGSVTSEVKTDGVNMCVNFWRDASEPDEDDELRDHRLQDAFGDRDDCFARDAGETLLSFTPLLEKWLPGPG